MYDKIKIIESPRDAMQGIKSFIPTELKIKYLNQLLKVGFDSLDFGSFVSPKAIPQLKDTSEIVGKLELSSSKTKLLAIVGNLKGATQATDFDEIHYLGFPYSLSETFLKINLNSTKSEVLKTIEQIQNICIKRNKTLLLYFTFAFGNPYGDKYSNADIISEISDFKKIGIEEFGLTDILGIATSENITKIFSDIFRCFENIEIGLHLHTEPKNWYEKIHAAFQSGCKRFDVVLNGFGGCPMTSSELVGNLDTNNLLQYFSNNNIELNINSEELKIANEISNEIFTEYL
jgi:hydroxymethylglutaryl-CoA lyase